MDIEKKIKHNLLPYQVHLKITQIGQYFDNKPMIPDVPISEDTSWGVLDATCMYDLPEKNIPNDLQSKVFEKNDCPSGEIPSGTVTYTVPEGTYFGYNKDEANLYALEDIQENGQNYANTNGSCLLILEKLLFTTNDSSESTAFQIWLNQWTGDIGQPVNLVVKKGSNVIKDQQVAIGGIGPTLFDLEETDVQVYVKGEQSIFNLIKELSIDGIAGEDWGIDSVYPEIFPELTKFNTSGQKSLTSIDWSSNIKLDRLEIYENNIQGFADVSMLPDLYAFEFYNNDITGCSSLTNHPDLAYFNSAGNANFTSALDFTNCTDINTIITINCNVSSITGTDGKQFLERLDLNNNIGMTGSIDATTNPALEVVSIINTEITPFTWDEDTILKGVFVGGSPSTLSEQSIHDGIAANRLTLEALSVSAMDHITGFFDIEDFPNLHFLWLDSLPDCSGFSIDGTDNITNLNIAGMHLLTSLPDLGNNPLNAVAAVTGTGIGPAGVDALLIHISNQNLPPIQEHPAGPGFILYGNYDTIIGEITPTAASLAAYNDLISRGYTIIGPVPGS